MATATKTTGIKGLCCIRCHELDCVSLDLDDCMMRCRECSEEFTAEDVREWMQSLSRWQEALNWIATMPRGE